MHITIANLIEISRRVAGIQKYFLFSRWQPSTILNLCGKFWNNPQRVLSGLHQCVKLAENRYSIALIIQMFQYFKGFGALDTPKSVYIHRIGWWALQHCKHCHDTLRCGVFCM